MRKSLATACLQFVLCLLALPEKTRCAPLLDGFSGDGQPGGPRDTWDVVFHGRTNDVAYRSIHVYDSFDSLLTPSGSRMLVRAFGSVTGGLGTLRIDEDGDTLWLSVDSRVDRPAESAIVALFITTNALDTNVSERVERMVRRELSRAARELVPPPPRDNFLARIPKAGLLNLFFGALIFVILVLKRRG